MEEFPIPNAWAIPSPSLVIFLERVERNLQRMLEIAGGPARLRPHVKTHKLAPLIERQVALGITKFKAATIAEAEMCAAAGAKDVLLAYPPAGPTASRLCELVARFANTRFGIVADSAVAIRGLSVAARAAEVELNVFLDLDVGMGRTGVMPGPPAFELYRLLATTPALRPAGLHAYDGHIHMADAGERRTQSESAFAPVLALRRELESAGLAVPALIAGGTPTFPFHAAHSDRECSPGTTVLWDTGYAEKFADLPFEIAAVVLARVVSKPAANRVCLDLGHKAVAAENPLAARVRILELPDAVPVMHSEEHLVIETAAAKKTVIGATLHALPRHICPTVALYSEALIVKEDGSTERWPVSARGRRLTV